MLQPDFRGSLDSGAVIDEIRSQLSARDNSVLDLLLKGWDPDSLDEDFYRKAAASGSPFIRNYFAYDLQLRNAKVNWLNKALHRPEGEDIVSFGPEDFDDLQRVNAILDTPDILGRERGLDDILWQKIDDLTVMDVFDLDAILGFTAKLKIVDRWLKLDEAAGRELFHKLVKEIKENYTI